MLHLNEQLWAKEDSHCLVLILNFIFKVFFTIYILLPVTIKNIALPFQLHNAYLVAYYRDCISICTSEEAFYYDVYFRHEVFKFKTCVLAAKVHVYGKKKKKTTFEGTWM